MSKTTKNTTEQTSPKASTRWGQDRRLAFIDFRLRWDGYINRSDLTDFFGISIPQASLDVARYTELASQNLSYDRSSRVYQATEMFSPIYSETHPQRYLTDLLASANGVLESSLSYIGWQPPIAAVPQPERIVEPGLLAALLKAIRQELGLKVVYQSMSRPEPHERIITPHALAYDGFRWHVRAFCHDHEEFRDFVLGRFLEVLDVEPVGKSGTEDLEWHTVLTLVLSPHSGLTAGKRRAIELDYGMREGEVQLKCRHALLFYTLRQLGLIEGGEQSPESQQIVLKNKSEIAPFLAAKRPSAREKASK